MKKNYKNSNIISSVYQKDDCYLLIFLLKNIVLVNNNNNNKKKKEIIPKKNIVVVPLEDDTIKYILQYIFRFFQGNCIKILDDDKHKGYVTCLFVYDDKVHNDDNNNKILISGYGDGTIKLWDLNNQRVSTLQENEKNDRIVNLCQFGKDKMISCNGTTIQIWDEIENGGNLDMVLEKDPREMDMITSCCAMGDKKIVSGNYLKTIDIWDMSNNIDNGGEANRRKLPGNNSMITFVSIYEDNKLLSCSYDIKIWDMDSGECNMTFEGHSDLVYAAVVVYGNGGSGGGDGGDNTIDNNTIDNNDNNKNDINFLVSGSRDETIKVWDMNSGECLRTVDSGHIGGVECLCIYGDKVVSGGVDGSIKIWNNIESGGDCSMTLQGHSKVVKALVVYGDKLVSGSGDETIKVWG